MPSAAGCLFSRCAPASEAAHQTIRLPHAYTFLCSACIYLGVVKNEGLLSVEFPPLTATVEYLDMLCCR